MQDIATVLGNGFFPVVMCAMLFWYITQKDQRHSEEITALKDQMESNNKNFIQALESVQTASKV